MILQGLISGAKNLQGGMNPEATLSGEMAEVILPPHYDGATSVTPTTSAQALYTKDKIVDHNIFVMPLSLTPTVMRPDAELVQTFSYDKRIHADEEIEIPAYTTTATTLKASANLSPTITVDPDEKSFFIVERFLTIPEYSISTVGKARPEYTYCTYIYDLTRVPAGTFSDMNGTKTVATASSIIDTMSSYRLLYWSSGSALSLYASNGYGCYQTPTAPAISGSTLTVKAPALAVRGSTSYFTSTYMNALTDIRYQYVIDVYTAPKEHIGLDGWIMNELVNHVLDCVNSTTHKLT